MCCSVWGQLKMFNSDTRARTLERLHTQASRERKGKQWCRSLQLADWPKGFTLKLSQRAREGGREGETAGVREGRGGGRNEEGKNSVIEEKKREVKLKGSCPPQRKTEDGLQFIFSFPICCHLSLLRSCSLRASLLSPNVSRTRLKMFHPVF